ncbi:MAG: hypothetical protein JKY92_05765 [Magnetovibrio sp.]|nr:hypothetical protein [Magnetovibrio sp.]
MHNRMWLLTEILDAVCIVWSSGHVGVRLSPENSFKSMSDSAPRAHFKEIVETLRPVQLGLFSCP